MDEVVLVTGGSRGIGRAVALMLAGAGRAVAVNYRSDSEAAEAVVAGIEARGGRALAIRADASREAEIGAMFERVDGELGPLTGLVNNAGIGSRVRADAAGADALERLMATNVVGPMLCCREAIKRMSTAYGGRGGAIVSVSSMAATTGGRPGAAHYAASKAAIDAFTMGLAKEVATEGIRVNAVRPGVTETDMVAPVRDDPARRREVEATIAMNRIGKPEEIAAAVCWLLSPAASFISGARLDASGGGFVIGASPDPEASRHPEASRR